MFSLIIDTSSEKGVVIISQGVDLVFTKELPPGLLNSRYLLSTILVGFQALNINTSSLKSVSVAIGPGSFTGIRVGVAAAKGIAIGAHLPLIGFESLLGYISAIEGPFASLIDAKMGCGYYLMQERVGKNIFPRGKIEIAPIEELKKILHPHPVVGPSLKDLKFENSIECYPDVAHLAALTEDRYQAKQYSTDGSLELIYLRSPVN